MNESSYVGLNPLKWNVLEISEKDDIWPKRTVGASLVYLEEKEKYILIGGNFNAFENSNKNFKLNRELIAGVEKTTSPSQLTLIINILSIFPFLSACPLKKCNNLKLGPQK